MNPNPNPTMQATIPLPLTMEQLAPRTRDWLLGKSARKDCSPQQVLIEALDNVARRELRPGPIRPAPHTEGRAA
jgi:hypothetical protein